MIDYLEAIISFLFDKDIFPALLIFSASIIGIYSFTKEIRFRSILSGMSEKIERIHKKNEALEEFCAKKLSQLLEDTAHIQEPHPLTDTDSEEIKEIASHLLSKSIGASRQLETYSLFLKHCISENLSTEKTINSLTRQQAYHIVLNTLEIIHKQSLSIIESPKRVKLEKKSPIRKDLRQFTSSKGFNSTPNVEIGPSANDTTDEALNFYSTCLNSNVPASQIGIFESFFEIIRGNHPFCLFMAADKILVPSQLTLENEPFSGKQFTYHAVGTSYKRNLAEEKVYIEVYYANISRGIQLSLSNKNEEKIIKEIGFCGTKTEIKREDIAELKKIEDKYIVLTFSREKAKSEYKRNRKYLEYYLLKESGNLNAIKGIEVFIKNFFRYKL